MENMMALRSSPQTTIFGDLTEGITSEEEIALDSALWEHLPYDMVEKLLMKLPYSNLVRLLPVSKSWRSNLIPCVVRRGAKFQEDIKSCHYRLIYFASGVDSFPGRARCWQIWDSKKSWNMISEDFQTGCFPTSESNNKVELLASEEGLLFFGLVDQNNDNIIKLFVCNPVLGQCKALFLPGWAPLTSGFSFSFKSTLVGVVVDTNQGNYKLVIAGLTEAGKRTIVYNSLLETWEERESLQVYGGTITECNPGRAVSCKGNLYWYLNCDMENDPEKTRGDMDAIVKYDVGEGTWNLFRTDNLTRRTIYLENIQIGYYNGKVLLSHMNKISSEIVHGIGERFRAECNLRFPEFCSEMAVMSIDMLDSVEKFLGRVNNGESPSRLNHSFEYESFGMGDFFFHIVTSPEGTRRRGGLDTMRVLVQNIVKNTYTLSPQLGERGLGERSLKNNRMLFGSKRERILRGGVLSPHAVWAFSPSMISLV